MDTIEKNIWRVKLWLSTYFAKLPIQFTRHSFSRFFSYVSNKEIVADEQPLQGYSLEVQAA